MMGRPVLLILFCPFAICEQLSLLCELRMDETDEHLSKYNKFTLTQNIERFFKVGTYLVFAYNFERYHCLGPGNYFSLLDSKLKSRFYFASSRYGSIIFAKHASPPLQRYELNKKIPRIKKMGA